MENEIGYRFHPSDEELVDHHLRQKLLGTGEKSWQIPEINVLNHEPWELPNYYTLPINPNDQVWYFFYAPIYKSANSKRLSRTTNAGYWKVTGKYRSIKDIATKKTLVFYKGRPNDGVKTNWVMHEYHPKFGFQNQKDFVVCKIKRKQDVNDVADVPNADEGSESRDKTNTADVAPPVVSNYISVNTTINEEEETQMQAYVQSFNGHNEADYNLNSAF